MVDPLAVTSLGITVCKSLVQVISAWRDFNDDLKETEEQIQVLSNTFKVIHQRIQGSSSSSASRSLVTDCLTSCNGAVRRLETNLGKLKTYKPLKHATYPITQSSLKGLRALLRHLQSELSLALQVLALETASDVRDESQSMTLNNSLLRTSVQNIHNNVIDLAQKFVDYLREHDAKIDLVTNKLTDLNHSVSTIENSTRRLVDTTNRIESSSKATVLEFASQMHDLPLRISQEHVPVYNVLEQRTDAIMRLPGSTTSRKDAASFLLSPSVYAELLDQALAAPSPNIYKRRKSSDLHFCYRIPLKILSRSVDIVFSFSYGSGGLSLSASLQLKGMIVEDSPAFKAMERISFSCNRIYDKEVFVAELEALEIQLTRIFQRGEGSPTDINPISKNLCQMFLREFPSYFVNYHQFLGEQKVVDAIKGFFSALKSLGVPFDEAIPNGPGVAEEIIHRTLRRKTHYSHLNNCTGQIFNHLLNLGLERKYTNNPIDCINQKGENPNKRSQMFYFSASAILVRCIRSSVEDIAYDYPIGKLGLSVMRRDYTRLTALLESRSCVIDEQDFYGITPLHLACLRNWPLGVKEIISAGADVNATVGIFQGARFQVRGCFATNAIGFATIFGCPETVRAVLSGKPAIMDKDHPEAADFINFTVERSNNPQWRIENLRILVQELISSSMLSSADYHTPELHIDFARALWDNEIRNVDVLDQNGLTPLQYHYLTGRKSICYFFINKGCSFDLSWHDGPWYLPHIRAVTATHCRWYRTHLQEVIGPLEATDQLDALCGIYDVCQCACSSQGCTATTIMARHITWNGHALKNGGEYLFETLDIWLSYFPETLKPFVEEQILQVFIFEGLGLRHTCCQPSRRKPVGWSPEITWIEARYTKEAADEIREEESDMIRLVKGMVELALEQRHHYEGAFGAFVFEFLREEIWENQQPDQADYIRRVRELGVEMHASS